MRFESSRNPGKKLNQGVLKTDAHILYVWVWSFKHVGLAIFQNQNLCEILTKGVNSQIFLIGYTALQKILLLRLSIQNTDFIYHWLSVTNRRYDNAIICFLIDFPIIPLFISCH